MWNSSGQVTLNCSVAPTGPDRATRERLRGLVTDILATKSSARHFTDDETLAEIGIASIDMVTLLLSVEREFDVEVPTHEITADVFRSISTIDSLVGRLLPSPGTARHG